MNSENISNKLKKELNINKSKVNLENLRSDYFLQRIFDNIKRNRSLEIIKNNKQIQKRLNISIKDYKEYYELYTPIEIEIIPIIPYKSQFEKFINNYNKEYIHIYFNDDKKETKRKFLLKNDICDKITIIIDHQIKSFEKLFYECKCIESLFFKKFHRII